MPIDEAVAAATANGAARQELERRFVAVLQSSKRPRWPRNTSAANSP